MTTTAEIATVPQIKVIKGLSNAIWGSEWIVLDEYGDSEGVVDRDVANKLVEVLHQFKKLPLDQLDDGEKLDALTSIMAGQPIPLTLPGSSPLPDVIVDLPAALPAWERFEIADSADPTKEDTTDTKTRKPRDLIPIDHGTNRGAQAHQRRGIPMCEPCRQAKSEYQRQLNAMRSGSGLPVPKRPVKRRAKASKSSSVALAPVQPAASNGHDQLLEGLIGLLPATHETFTEAAKARWAAFARLTLDIVWPNS